MTEGGERVSIRAHYERFPATVKGAFVLRGEDRDPHQVRILEATLVELSGAGSRPLGIADVTLDVAPHLDLFVPFELPVTDLAPGWYAFACDVAIDGRPASIRPGRPFPVAWPRGSVRRGSQTIGRTARLGDGTKVRVEQLECGADSIALAYASSSGEPAEIRLAADGRRLPSLESGFEEGSGTGRVVAYPLLKTHERLSIEVRGASPFEIALR